MGRSIVNAPLAGNVATRGGPTAGPANGGDDYGDRLLKLIPAEVIALFMTMDAMIADNGDNTPTVSIITLALGMFATWFYMHVFQKVDNLPQIAVSVLAFAVWAINIGSGFQDGFLIKPSYAALTLLVFTFFAPKLPLGNKPKILPPL